VKKSVFLAALGLAYSVATSYGQGYVLFSSYSANGLVGASTTIVENGQLVGPAWHAELYYALGTVSDPVNFSSVASIISPVSSALTLVQGVSAQYANYGPADLGYFDDGRIEIPDYTSGPITFEVFASTYDGSGRGRSGSFTMDVIAGPRQPASLFGDNGQPMPNFFVSILPEPSTLAMAGLSGLVWLVMRRRKHS
jgi:PEP-CTERM motif